jgi:hypothetical protein
MMTFKEREQWYHRIGTMAIDTKRDSTKSRSENIGAYCLSCLALGGFPLELLYGIVFVCSLLESHGEIGRISLLSHLGEHPRLLL